MHTDCGNLREPNALGEPPADPPKDPRNNGKDPTPPAEPKEKTLLETTRAAAQKAHKAFDAFEAQASAADKNTAHNAYLLFFSTRTHALFLHHLLRINPTPHYRITGSPKGEPLKFI